MKISASKLIANWSNSVKFAELRSLEGKRIASQNANNSGLALSSIVNIDLEVSSLAVLVAEARDFGFAKKARGS